MPIKTNNRMRKGPWSVEEEKYTITVVKLFIAGVLDIPEGTTLRSYVASLLHCDPMRVSKKFQPNRLGSKCYTKRCSLSLLDEQAAKEILESLRKEFEAATLASNTNPRSSKRLAVAARPLFLNDTTIHAENFASSHEQYTRTFNDIAPLHLLDN